MITSNQSFQIYDILKRNLKNEDDAKALVKEIEAVIEGRFLAERDRLATKEDIAKMETRIIMWMVGFNTVLSGLIIAAFKLL